MQILFASQNKGKQNEARALFKDLPVEFVFPDQFPELAGFDPEETGTTFAENALLKARAYAEVVQIPCIADDSGVEVDGMDQLPGVHSNRWFEGTADERNEEVLKRLTPDKPRTARYITVACYYDPVSEEYALYEETQEGSIAHKSVQGEGFDYDRIFIPEGYDKTYSQLGQEVKNQNSQRARAYRKLHEFLKELLALKR
ncbi:MAG: non-canonical purine NTP pyrophosphatase [Patescibacteria group bacterium]|nr:MAG: non-canonical purine NTP pyrophosphatase [Patescibacteria group bacterium]